MLTAPFALFLASCLVPERDIDRTRIVGTLRIDPVELEETSELANNLPAAPIETDPLHYGYRIFNGTLLEFGYDEENDEFTGDADHWLITTPVPREGDNPITVDITLADGSAEAVVRVLNLNEPQPLTNEPTVIVEETFTSWTEISFEALPEISYSVGIYGVSGEPNTTYRAFTLGQHPDDAGILVGAYQNEKATERGSLLGGTNAKTWEANADLAFESWYEMLFIRDFATDEDGDVEVLDENVKEAWVYAGTWANLSQPLPAGTWYSKSPVFARIADAGAPQTPGTPPADPDEKGDDTDEPVAEPLIRDIPAYPTLVIEEPLVIDRIAPVVIGQEWDEATTEPNDTDISEEFVDKDLAYDLGVLSGAGFVDKIYNGSVTDNGYNYWTGDNDTFKFQVPEPVLLNFNLKWSDSEHDLDVILTDSEGNTIDQGFYGFPEIPEVGTEVLQPGQDYYIAVLLWIGTGVDGDALTYELSMEQVSQ